MIPAVSPAAYDAARHRAALIDRSGRGRIVVSGADRAAYLQGLLTNDVVALKAGQGCYAAYLTAQGRMIADLHVYELGDVMLLTMAGDVKDGVLAKLDQFIFTEDVQLGDATDTFAQIAVVGPRAAQAIAGVVTGLSAERLRDLAEHGNLRAPWGGGTAIVARVTDTGESAWGILIGIVAKIGMPILAAYKLKVAAQLNSRALRADAVESITCGYLSIVLMIGLAATRLLGWWWLASVAALALIPFVVKEAREAIRGECECCETEALSS